MEDRCGAPTVHRALARIVRILRGKTWSVSDLRSAMEAECGADLADFFRQWLIRPGIPDDFRARYIGAPAAVKPTGKNN
jgi:aminopeptidase N